MRCIILVVLLIYSWHITVSFISKYQNFYADQGEKRMLTAVKIQNLQLQVLLHDIILYLLFGHLIKVLPGHRCYPFKKKKKKIS